MGIITKVMVTKDATTILDVRSTWEAVNKRVAHIRNLMEVCLFPLEPALLDWEVYCSCTLPIIVQVDWRSRLWEGKSEWKNCKVEIWRINKILLYTKTKTSMRFMLLVSK